MAVVWLATWLLGEVIRGWAGRVASWLMQGMPLVILWRRELRSLPRFLPWVVLVTPHPAIAEGA